jgi:hypothetical protein
VCSKNPVDRQTFAGQKIADLGQQTMTTSPAGMDVRDRIVCCLTALVVCDSLGTTLEFNHTGSFEPVDDMVAGVPLRLEPGQWTDDTSMGWTRRDATGAKS